MLLELLQDYNRKMDDLIEYHRKKVKNAHALKAHR